MIHSFIDTVITISDWENCNKVGDHDLDQFDYLVS